MILIPIGVIFGGYTLLWYGFSLIKGPGMGILDLVSPSRVSQADSVRKGWDQGVSYGPDPGTVPAGPGVQSGTYPQAPGQSGPSVPPPPSGHYPSTPPSSESGSAHP